MRTIGLPALRWRARRQLGRDCGGDAAHAGYAERSEYQLQSWHSLIQCLRKTARAVHQQRGTKQSNWRALDGAFRLRHSPSK